MEIFIFVSVSELSIPPKFTRGTRLTVEHYVFLKISISHSFHLSSAVLIAYYVLVDLLLVYGKR